MVPVRQSLSLMVLTATWSPSVISKVAWVTGVSCKCSRKGIPRLSPFPRQLIWEKLLNICMVGSIMESSWKSLSRNCKIPPTSSSVTALKLQMFYIQIILMMMMMAKYISLNNRLTERVSQGWLRERQIVGSHLTRIPVCHGRWSDCHCRAQSPHAFSRSCHCQPRKVEIAQKFGVLTVQRDCCACPGHPRESIQGAPASRGEGRRRWARVPSTVAISDELCRSTLAD